MKHGPLRFATIALAVGGAAFWFLGRPAITSRNQRVQTTVFQGYTNGTVGPAAAIFITNSPQGSIVQNWYGAGAIAGLFTVTNVENVPIRLYPFGRFYTKGQPPLDETTFLLDVPSLNGFYLDPGRSVAFQVAILSRAEPWRLQLFYEANSASTLGSRIRELVTLRRTKPEKQEIYSDWVTP